MNVTQIIPEFSAANLTAILNNNPLGDLQYRNYFPVEFKTDLNWGNIETEAGAKVMADVVAMDSDVILKGRETASIITGDIPKIETGRMMNEKGFFDLEKLRNALRANPKNQSVSNQLVQAIYGDAIAVTNSVNATLEFLSKSLLSKGSYKTESGVNIDFKIKTKNASLDWFSPDNAKTFDPIKDLREAQKEALAKGYRFVTATMDLATFNQFVASESVIKFTASFAQNALGLAQTPTLEQVNSALRSQNLPIINIWESYISKEAKDGSLTSTSGWDLGNIHLSATESFGATQYTISPEANMDLGETTKVTVNDLILVSTIGSAAPMRVLTKGMAFATPVLNNTKKRLILKTKLS